MSKNLYKENNLDDLIIKAQQGDSKALEELIRRVQKDVYAMFSHLVGKKEEVSDLTQETLLKIAKYLYQLKDIKNFRAWRNKVVTNVFYDYLKKNPNNIIEIDEEQLNSIKDKIGCEPGEKCLFSEIEKVIKAALMTLPHNLRITLVLREYEGLSYDDISKITNVNLGTVKSRLSRARLKLQKELKEFI